MSQKIPLFQGIPLPLHNGTSAPPIPVVDNFVFTPPDKALNPQGTQAFYELHLWVVGNTSVLDIIKLRAYNDDEGVGTAKTVLVASMGQLGVLDPRRQPTKILDGYPVRGKVTLTCQYLAATEADLYPVGAQLYGYYVRVGEGVVRSPARRFIGEASPDGIAAGVPHFIASEASGVIHTFDGSRFDELGLQVAPVDHNELLQVSLVFVDESLAPVGPGGALLVTAGVYPPFALGGDYLIQSVFGGYPNLKHIVANVITAGSGVAIQGYFTRR